MSATPLSPRYRVTYTKARDVIRQEFTSLPEALAYIADRLAKDMHTKCSIENVPGWRVVERRRA